MPRRELTTGSTGAHLLALAGPMVFAIIAVLSVSLADSYFVGKLGTTALAALAFTFPVSFAVASVAIGLGAGASSVVARILGTGDEHQARRASTDSLVLAVVLVSIVSATGYFCIEPLFSALGAHGEVLVLIERYMSIWFLSMPFLVIPMVANAIVRATGDSLWPSLNMIFAALVNLVLTPAMVLGYGPIPRFELEGAAYSTLIARAFTLVFALFIVGVREKLLTAVRPAWDEVVASWKRIAAVGLPAALGNMVNPVGVGIITAFLASFGEPTVAAFGVSTRVEAFACIPLLALSSAVGPVAGQNWGARSYHRVREALELCFTVSVLWSIALVGVFYFFGEWIAHLFAPEDSVAKDAAFYLRVVALSLWGYGFIITAAATFNGIGRARLGLAYYLIRIAVCYVPFSWIGMHFAEARGVFVGIAAANAVAGLAVGWFALRWIRRYSPR